VAAAADPESVFASVGCRFEDAASLAREKYRLQLCIPNPDAANPVDWSEPLLAVGLRQSERAWLNGCLTGLFMAGPLAETMPSTALRTAQTTLNAQALEASERTGELVSVEQTLASVELDPKAFLKAAAPVAVEFARPLEEFALEPLDMAHCAHTLSAMWLMGVLLATQARREHARP
jgi:hypothetical protein